MRKDEAFLHHIFDSICDSENFIKNVTFEGFLKNKQIQYAVLRALEIMGEATKHLSGELKAKHPEVPWKKVAGMRDKLIHEYFGVNLKLVWETVKINLPELKGQILEMLKEMKDG